MVCTCVHLFLEKVEACKIFFAGITGGLGRREIPGIDKLCRLFFLFAPQASLYMSGDDHDDGDYQGKMEMKHVGCSCSVGMSWGAFPLSILVCVEWFFPLHYFPWCYSGEKGRDAWFPMLAGLSFLYLLSMCELVRNE